MVHIALTNGGYAVIDEEDRELVEAHGPWYSVSGRHTRYAATTKRKPRIKMHILIMGKKSGMIVDHRDEDGLNNRRSNLQHTSNGHNVRKSTRNKGYRKWGNKYQVRMRVNGKAILESYGTEAEAIARVNELKTQPPAWSIMRSS